MLNYLLSAHESSHVPPSQAPGPVGSAPARQPAAMDLGALLKMFQPAPVQPPPPIQVGKYARRGRAVPNLFPEKNAEASQVRTGITPRMNANNLRRLMGGGNASV